jgi:hypothetical protein
MKLKQLIKEWAMALVILAVFYLFVVLVFSFGE